MVPAVNEEVEVKPCSHGRGVFARRRFEKGQVIAALTNQRFTRTTKSRGYALRIGKYLYWDEETNIRLQTWARYLDHGIPSNVHLSFQPARGIVIVTASDAIDEGEELLINYAEYYPVNYPSNPWSIESLDGGAKGVGESKNTHLLSLDPSHRDLLLSGALSGPRSQLYFSWAS